MQSGMSRVFHNLSKLHWDIVKRILKYLKYARTKGLTLNGKEGWDLMLYADSDFARDESDRHCVTGAAMICAGAAIYWFSGTRRCVAPSSTESEYVAMTIAFKKQYPSSRH